MSRNVIHFYGEDLLAPRSTPTLVDDPMPLVRNSPFNIFAAVFCTRDRSSIRFLRTRLALRQGPKHQGGDFTFPQE
jgi:hypothetical protein